MRPVIFALAVVVLAVTGAAIHAAGLPIDWAQAGPTIGTRTIHAELGMVPFNGSWVNVAIVHHRDLPRYSEDQKVYYIDTDSRRGISAGDTVVGFATLHCHYCGTHIQRFERRFVIE
ncbi:MAG: hypothetical protein GY722_07570 [bacterium]|nr:hypothetical protein [bacterium]